MRTFLVLALLLLLPSACRADARLSFTAADPMAELVVTGTVTAAAPVAVTIRVDDGPGLSYVERVNEERMLPPGPFLLRLRLAALRTPRGKALRPGAAWSATAFAPNGGVDVSPLRLDLPPALPEGVRGWYFGPDWSLPLRGFTSVQPGDPQVSGSAILAISRPGGDPVLSHGMRLTGFTTALPPGRWHLALWTEDPGEWETLPAVMERRVRVNGDDISETRQSYAQWVARRYFAGRNQEADPRRLPFAALGARRGGRIEGTAVVAADGVLKIELAGFPQGSSHMVAIIAVPAGMPGGLGAAVDAVESLRAARFAEAWPVLTPPPPAPRAERVTIARIAPVTTAPDGVVVMRTEVTVPAALIASAQVEWDRGGPTARVLWGQWRWRRPAANSAGLDFSAAHLRGDSAAIPLRPDLPRPLVVLLRGGTPGRHQGKLILRWPGGEASVPLEAEVLDVPRRRAASRVGPFLDFAPHLLGDPEFDKTKARAAARAQSACDLAEVGRLGLAPMMPAVGKLNADFDGAIADLKAAGPGLAIAYAPLRALPRLEAPAWIARAEAALGAPVAWGVADEPSYNGTAEDALALAADVHRTAPGAKLAGFLNNPADAALLPALAVALVNTGYGADAEHIAALRARGIKPFLYNMPEPRLASGAYLWRSGAAGMAQWHGRMPTADAFDPTDGREGDVQFFWPSPGICDPHDLDADVLDLVEGAEDLRWLAWLDAAKDRRAVALRARLWAEVPDRWNAAARLAGKASVWRRDIVELARLLKE